MNISDSGFQVESGLPLPEHEVQLWRVDLEAVRHDESRWLELLSSDERERASRFHFPEDRQRFAAGRALLRKILAAYLNTKPTDLKFSYSGKQKPSLEGTQTAGGLSFNVSHSGGIALFAFAWRREIGVDVELVRYDFDVEPIARRFFSTHEQKQLAALPPEERVDAFFRCWTRKEAYVKATGDGLSLPLRQFDVSLDSFLETNALIATRPDPSETGRWFLRDVPAGAGYRAALCVQGQDWTLRPCSDKAAVPS